MALRNRVVRLVGLKDLGHMTVSRSLDQSSTYAVGNRVGIFTLYANCFEEAVLGDRDKHLDVMVSVHRSAPNGDSVLITVTTVVHVHNMLGRLYMLPVRPMHRIITPTVLAEASRAHRV